MTYVEIYIVIIDTGEGTEWSLIWSVIIRVITKSDNHEAEVRFVNREYDYRPTSDDTYKVHLPRNKNTLVL